VSALHDTARAIAERHFGGGFSRERAEALYGDILVALEAERLAGDDRRHSLAQEIAGCLRSRGAAWVPDARDHAHDLIPAVGQFVDASLVRAEAVVAASVKLVAERDRLRAALARIERRVTGLAEQQAEAFYIRDAVRAEIRAAGGPWGGAQ